MQPRYTAVYDGDCAICQRFARKLARWDRERRFEIVAFQDAGVQARFPWIPAAAFTESLQLVREDGRTWQGAAAIEEVTRTLRRGRSVSWIFSVPFARPLAEKFYRWFARRRHKLGCGKHCRAGAGNRAAVVLVSGGLDSTTALAMAAGEGYSVYALTVRYGQRHATEIDAARAVASRAGVIEHKIVELDLRAFGGSALTDSAIGVPKDRDPREHDDIPATYVPARNTILLSLALAWTEAIGAHDMFIGVNALDYSGYPDCRPEFIEAFERAANLGTKAGTSGEHIRIHAPLISLSKSEIIQRGVALGVDYSITISCYDPGPDGAACGRCDACVLRLRGFEEAGLRDPARYAPQQAGAR